MPALSPLNQRDPALDLRDTLLRGLREGRWRCGERLPTERELAHHFGVGRTVVRRVLTGLCEAGLIHRSVGSGTYVNDDALTRLRQAPTAPISPAELIEARLYVEPMLLDLVVARATAADFSVMDDCCERAEAASTAADFEHWDAALHERIAAATHNTFFVAMYQLIQEAREREEWGMLNRHSHTAQRRLQYQRDHRELVAALKARDARLAREHMIAHLDRVSRDLLRPQAETALR